MKSLKNRVVPIMYMSMYRYMEHELYIKCTPAQALKHSFSIEEFFQVPDETWS